MGTIRGAGEENPRAGDRAVPERVSQDAPRISSSAFCPDSRQPLAVFGSQTSLFIFSSATLKFLLSLCIKPDLFVFHIPFPHFHHGYSFIKRIAIPLIQSCLFK